jgi:hypothetical protein
MPMWQRFFEGLLGRIDGPMHFRIILQPTMASIFACIGGYKDARAGKPPYFWALFTTPGYRKEMLKDGWKHVGKVFILALVLDLIYELKVHHTVHPVEMLTVAVVLAFIPYLLLRGPVNRLCRIWIKPTTLPPAASESAPSAN